MKNSIRMYISTLLVGILTCPALPAEASWVENVCVDYLWCKEQSVVAASSKPEEKSISFNIMPDMSVFQDKNTPEECGLFAAARVLGWLGYRKGNSSDVFYWLKKFRDLELHSTEPFGSTKLGTTPHFLAELIGNISPRGNVKIERGAFFTRMKAILNTGRPVIALVRNGTSEVKGVTIPLLHWIVIEGHDDYRRIVYYRDTTDNYLHTVSYDSFLAKTAGAGTPDAPTWTWKVGEGLAATALEEAGATSSTMLWIDEPVPGSGLNEAAHYNSQGGLVFSLGGEDDPYIAPKKVPPSDLPLINQSCYKVNANQGWQTFVSEGTFSKITYITGGWSVDGVNYPLVGPLGHIDPVEVASLNPFNSYKTDQSHPFGAMLLNIRGLGYYGTTGNVQLLQPISGEFDIRINDEALADNTGFIKVCFSQ